MRAVELSASPVTILNALHAFSALYVQARIIVLENRQESNVAFVWCSEIWNVKAIEIDRNSLLTRTRFLYGTHCSRGWAELTIKLYSLIRRTHGMAWKGRWAIRKIRKKRTATSEAKRSKAAGKRARQKKATLSELQLVCATHTKLYLTSEIVMFYYSFISLFANNTILP